jgi:hypothetical protein
MEWLNPIGVGLGSFSISIGLYALLKFPDILINFLGIAFISLGITLLLLPQ